MPGAFRVERMQSITRHRVAKNKNKIMPNPTPAKADNQGELKKNIKQKLKLAKTCHKLQQNI